MWLLLGSIFKFICIMILILFLFLLSALCIILAVPIKYELAASKYEEVLFSFNITWLFGLIGFEKYDNNGYRLKLFWLNLRRKGDVKEHSESAREPSSTLKSKRKTDYNTEDAAKKDAKRFKAYRKTNEGKAMHENKEKVKDVPEKTEKNKSSILDKIKWLFGLTCKGEIVGLTLWLFKKLLAAPRFEKVFLDITAGFDEPDMTGYLLGIAGILQTMIPFDINIKGDFEKEILQGKVYVKGSIVLWFVFYPFVIYAFKLAKIIVLSVLIPKIRRNIPFFGKRIRT